jgi:riboflavin biosynthesis pyrimidine reductase
LLEGGGVTNGAFLRAGLVDEVSLILFPRVDGAKGAPAVFDSLQNLPRPSVPVRSMTLESNQTLEGGALWLRYKLQND